MISRLAAARDSLRSALDRYRSVCLAIDKSCVRYSSQDAFPELMTALSDELAQVSSYEKSLLEAKIALRQARNRSSSVVPISRLTTDVLTQIFQFVTEGNCCAHKLRKTNKHVIPTYPHLLTRVCSQWRQIVLSSTCLWSHIDIPFPFSCDKTTLNRMKKYTARSGTSLLDVHIVELDNPQLIAPMGAGALTRVLEPLSTRIRSLELKLSASPTRALGPMASSGIVGYSIPFSACFSNCTAGVLERLVIRTGESILPCTFIAAAFSAPWGNARPYGIPTEPVVSLSVSEQNLENLWLPLSVLKLKGFYPCWTSKAYHGLVELRLGATGTVPIPQAELMKILKSSPQLRILDFGLTITKSYSQNTPVLLENLQTLIVNEDTPEEIEDLLCLIAPGTHPLSIYLRRGPGQFGPEVRKFFARANVDIIGVSDFYSYQQISDLLRLIPDVRTLALNQVNFGTVDWSKHKLSSTNSFLHDLYLLRETVITQSDLIYMIEIHRVQRLVAVEGCAVKDAHEDLVRDYQTLQQLISPLGLEFEFIPRGASHPLCEWDWNS